MEELRRQTGDRLAGKPPSPEVFAHPIAFNVFSHDSDVADCGYNGEELKVAAESRKILHEPALPIAVTCVRVPVLRAHCASINLTFRESMTEEQAREILGDSPGVRVVDDRVANKFPEPIDAAGQDDVLVGRIRADVSQPPGKGLELFVAGDQLRKGAALNAVQIAEYLVQAPARTV